MKYGCMLRRSYFTIRTRHVHGPLGSAKRSLLPLISTQLGLVETLAIDNSMSIKAKKARLKSKRVVMTQ